MTSYLTLAFAAVGGGFLVLAALVAGELEGRPWKWRQAAANAAAAMCLLLAAYGDSSYAALVGAVLSVLLAGGISAWRLVVLRRDLQKLGRK